MIDKAKDLLRKDVLNVDNLNEEISALNDQLANITDYSGEEYPRLTKELSDKTHIRDTVVSLTKSLENYEDAKSITSEDEELFELAQLEIGELEETIGELANKLEELSVKPLPNDNAKAIFEIRPGVGGSESSLFAEELYRMYTRYLGSQGLKVENYSMDYDQEGGIKEASFLVDAAGAFGQLRFESGVHRVQRVPVTESAGRIHTSTVSVVVLPQIDAKEINIKTEDLKIDFYRSSGPGGQSVNTTDSAVRLTHIPTGTVVTCQNGKSQHKNKEMAMNVLVAKLTKMEEDERMSKEKDMRAASILGGDRSAKIRTYNFPQGRITDHRVQKSWFNIDVAMDGEIDDIVTEVRRDLRIQLED